MLLLSLKNIHLLKERTKKTIHLQEMYPKREHHAPGSHVAAKRVESLDYLMSANRNLLIAVTACFGAMVFASAAETRVTNILSGIVAGVFIVAILIIAWVHGVMVWRHSALIGVQNNIWYVLPVLAVVVVWVPAIAYLILLYIT